jgi:hypothetical protein
MAGHWPACSAGETEAAHLRPRVNRTDRNVPATGVYRQGGFFGYSGFEVVQCKTSSGLLEFAVPRPDVPLMLHYLGLKGRS